MKSISPLLRKIYANSDWTDVIIQTNQKQFSCHKIILSVSFPFFRELFNSLQDEENTVLIMEDLSPEEVDLLLKFVYGLEKTLPESVVKLLARSECSANTIVKKSEDNEIVKLEPTDSQDFISHSLFDAPDAEPDIDTSTENYGFDKMEESNIKDDPGDMTKIGIVRGKKKRGRPPNPDKVKKKPKLKPTKLKEGATYKQCPYCQIKLARQYLSEHIRKEHMEMWETYKRENPNIARQTHKYPKTCDLCPELIISGSRYKSHLKAEHPDCDIKSLVQKQKSPYPKKCEFCPQTSGNSNDYYRHRLVCKFNPNRGQIDETNIKYARRNYNYDFVAKAEKGELGNEICDKCGQNFESKVALSIHERKHEKEIPCEIENCHGVFENTNIYKEHMLVAHGIVAKKPVYKNNELVTKTASEGEIRKQKIENLDPSQLHLCSECGKEFATASGLAGHMKYHHFEDSQKFKRVMCTICGKEYHHSGSLKEHIAAVHGTERPFKCSHCDKAFPHKKGLRRHMLDIHMPDDQKKFQCNICFKGFNTTRKYDDHMNVHTNAKPYSCDHCGAAYQNQSNLRSHMLKSCKNNPAGVL